MICRKGKTKLKGSRNAIVWKMKLMADDRHEGIADKHSLIFCPPKTNKKGLLLFSSMNFKVSVIPLASRCIL